MEKVKKEKEKEKEGAEQTKVAVAQAQIVRFLKSRVREGFTASELAAQTQVDIKDLSNESDLLTSLRGNPVVEITDSGLFMFRPKYPQVVSKDSMLSLLLDTAKSMVVTVDELSECYKEAANDIKNLEKDGCVSVAHGFVRASNYAITIDPELKIQWNLIKLPNHAEVTKALESKNLPVATRVIKRQASDTSGDTKSRGRNTRVKITNSHLLSQADLDNFDVNESSLGSNSFRTA